KSRRFPPRSRSSAPDRGPDQVFSYGIGHSLRPPFMRSDFPGSVARRERANLIVILIWLFFIFFTSFIELSVFVRILELMLGVPTAFGDTVSVSQARPPPAIDFECSQLFRASSSRLTGPRVPQKPAPWLRQMRSETTVGLLRKSTVYGLNGHRRRPLPVHGL